MQDTPTKKVERYGRSDELFDRCLAYSADNHGTIDKGGIFAIYDAMIDARISEIHKAARLQVPEVDLEMVNLFKESLVNPAIVAHVRTNIGYDRMRLALDAHCEYLAAINAMLDGEQVAWGKVGGSNSDEEIVDLVFQRIQKFKKEEEQ